MGKSNLSCNQITGKWIFHNLIFCSQNSFSVRDVTISLSDTNTTNTLAVLWKSTETSIAKTLAVLWKSTETSIANTLAVLWKSTETSIAKTLAVLWKSTETDHTT